MKVLGIFGSPRKGGNTDILLEEALKGAQTEGAEVEGLHLIDFNIIPCRECLQCFNDGKCIILDDMQKIYPKLLEVDIIILASPRLGQGIDRQVSGPLVEEVHPPRGVIRKGREKEERLLHLRRRDKRAEGL